MILSQVTKSEMEKRTENEMDTGVVEVLLLTSRLCVCARPPCLALGQSDHVCAFSTKLHISHSLKSLKGVWIGDYIGGGGGRIVVIKGDKSFDYSSYELLSISAVLRDP